MCSDGPDQPNIIWITLDSVRHDHTSVGGYERDTTPNLQAIADRQDGGSFETCITAGNWSLPSTASIHTGTYPSYHRAGYETDRLSDHVRTVPELLQAVGYRTVGVSANHYFSEATGLDRGFDVFKQIQPQAFLKEAGLLTTLKFLLGIRSHSGGITAEKSKHRPDYLVNEVVKDQLTVLADEHSPFFLSAHYHGAHHPYYPPPTRQDQFTDELDISGRRAADVAYRHTTDIHEQIARTDEFSERDWAALTAMYDTILAYCDDLIASLFDHVQSLDLENTVLVVTADHGDLLGEYGLLSHKFVLHDGLTHVPLVVHGATDLFGYSHELVQHLDVITTLVALAGGDTTHLQGIDLRTDRREYALSQRGPRTSEGLSKVRAHDPEFDDSAIHRNAVSALRTTSFKYRRSKGRAELFSLPDESTDVSDKHPDCVAALDDVLNERLESITGPEVDATAADFTGAAKDRLAELGYLVE